MKTIISFLLLTLVVFASCQKSTVETRTSSLPSMFSYLNALAKPTDVQIGIGGNGRMKIGKDPEMKLSLEASVAKNNVQVKQSGDIKINSFVFSPDGNKQYNSGSTITQEILGTKSSFGYTGENTNVPTGDDNGGMNDSLYVPAEMILDAPKYELDLDKNVITAGTTFKWKPDTENKNGVIVIVEYRPEYPGNDNEKYGKDLVRNGLVVDDNGSFSLTKELFVGILPGSHIDITVCRANYAIGENDEGVSYTIYAYNYKFGTYIFQ